MFKSITLAAVVIAASASIASAEPSNISNFVEKQDSKGLVELGTVTAEGNGIVEIYSFHKGVQGNLLGSETVKTGANANVRVQILQQNLDAIAVLTVNGQVVDTQELDFN